MTRSIVEKKALYASAIINLMMAFSGWVAYHFSHSQAILLDGNYSFIAFFITLIAIRITMIKTKLTETFPFGQYVYEALFSFGKGLMVIGILLVALIMSISRISHYLNDSPVDALNTSTVLVYTLVMLIMCVPLALYCRHENKKINDSSMILRAEYIGSKTDAIMSLSTGIVLFSIGFLDANGYFGFLYYVGDALLVIVLVLILVKDPILLARDSFVEMAGGTLQNKKEKQRIECILNDSLKTNIIKESYISKTGSNYFIVAYISAEQIDRIGSKELENIRKETLEALRLQYQHVMFEIALA
jgi:divalent metal cation (Fe/Co/Zn/Cd) transporter